MGTIKGLPQLSSQFKRLQKLNTVSASVAGAEIIKEASQDNAPVDTGFLRDSHEVVETPNGAEVVVNAPYAPAVEYGTSNMAAQPFLRPAIDTQGKKVVEAMAQDVQSQIKRAI
jgi:HK97 gp10 family phage protein